MLPLTSQGRRVCFLGAYQICLPTGLPIGQLNPTPWKRDTGAVVLQVHICWQRWECLGGWPVQGTAEFKGRRLPLEALRLSGGKNMKMPGT